MIIAFDISIGDIAILIIAQLVDHSEIVFAFSSRSFDPIVLNVNKPRLIRCKMMHRALDLIILFCVLIRFSSP